MKFSNKNKYAFKEINVRKFKIFLKIMLLTEHTIFHMFCNIHLSWRFSFTLSVMCLTHFFFQIPPKRMSYYEAFRYTRTHNGYSHLSLPREHWSASMAYEPSPCSGSSSVIRFSLLCLDMSITILILST